MKHSGHRRYTHEELHQLLVTERGFITPMVMSLEDPGVSQAIFCPYYVKLQGVLGPDWGVVVNPDSPNFGRLLFEHWHCGCPEGAHGEGKQVLDEWRDRKRERDLARNEEEARRPDQVQGEAGGVPPGSPRLDRDEGR